MSIRKQMPAAAAIPSKKVRSYTEIIEYLNAHWYTNNTSRTLDRVKQLDAALGNPSQKVSALIVAGTNGKSITIHLAAKLLKEEGLKVGILSSPHLVTYNERIAFNLEPISNKIFTDIGNEVINVAESLNLEAYSYELLTMMALVYFEQKKVDVALFEASEGGTYNAVNICHALVATITRVTPPGVITDEKAAKLMVEDIMGIVKKDTWLVSGDQSKTNLELMHELTAIHGGHWAMPIRKLAPLSYPYEQLHGRCAALAERIAQLFMEKYFNKDAVITADSLLSRKKSRRGRPTSDAKKKAELNPRKTTDQFWKGTISELSGRFEILSKEHPSVLLDTSSNLDAFENVLLGIRLLHYKKPFKGFSLIMAAAEGTMYGEEYLKLIRYFFKKTSGQIFICPLETPLPGTHEEQSWDIDKVTNDIKSMKVKARAYQSFKEAFDAAKQSVDEKDGLICITGSRSIVATYWTLKAPKKS